MSICFPLPLLLGLWRKNDFCLRAEFVPTFEILEEDRRLSITISGSFMTAPFIVGFPTMIADRAMPICWKSKGKGGKSSQTPFSMYRASQQIKQESESDKNAVRTSRIYRTVAVYFQRTPS
ncbi:hypothetical protein TNCT_663191 [Trichonephila clavata]|uniref:Uncharacterized protein n=1 Tax=Trichonephila clavata TaxID=2740835 RepID=A0A8X6LMK5_TRICU|nr:hypothetical protein TNCT_663191 [Trichonephila clavata]